MTINTVFRKSLFSFIITLAMLIFILFIANKTYAANAPNLVLNPNVDKTIAPNVTASYTTGTTYSVIDGLFVYNDFDSRWTSYNSPLLSSWLAIELDVPMSFNQVRLYFFNDSGGVRPPASYSIEYWIESQWVTASNQTKTPTQPTAEISSGATMQNTLNIVDFDTVTSKRIRVTFEGNGVATGLVELEVYNHSLLNTIAVATTLMDSAEEGGDIGQYGRGSIAALQEAIETARAVVDGYNLDQSLLDTTEQTLVGAINTFESMKIRLESFYSAFSNEAGDVITLHVSNTLMHYGEWNPDNFAVVNGQDTYSTVSFVTSNPWNNTIIITLNTPLPQNVANVRLQLQEGAFQTEEGYMSASVNDIIITTKSQLDINNDQLIGVDDLVKFMNRPSELLDINRDGSFDRTDVYILLLQVTPQFALHPMIN